MTASCTVVFPAPDLARIIRPKGLSRSRTWSPDSREPKPPALLRTRAFQDQKHAVQKARVFQERKRFLRAPVGSLKARLRPRPVFKPRRLQTVGGGEEIPPLAKRSTDGGALLAKASRASSR